MINAAGLASQCNNVYAHVQIRENDWMEYEVDACKTSESVARRGSGDRLVFLSVAMQQANSLRELHVQVRL
jgi:precorrin-4 methylase